MTHESCDEAALGGRFAVLGADLVFGVECPFPPGSLVLRRDGLDAIADPGLGSGLCLGDRRAGLVVLVGEGAGHPGELGDAGPGDGGAGWAGAFTAFSTAATLPAAVRRRA